MARNRKSRILTLASLLLICSAALALAACSGGGSSPSISTSSGTGGTGSTGGTGGTGGSGGSGPNVVVPPSFFGMTINILGPAAFNSRWPTVSIGTMAKTPGTNWYYLEEIQGSYHWTGLDNAVQAALANGAKTIIYTFYGTPSFYASNPSGPCYIPNATGCAEPPNTQDWTNFVSAVVTRYKGEITHYEIWNEPNRSDSWAGTTAQMVSLAQSAYQTIKSIDANAKVLSPGPAIGSDYASWIQGYLQGGGAQYSDGVAWHGYLCQDDPALNKVCPSDASCDSRAIDCAGTPLVNQVHDLQQAEAAANVSNLPLYDTEGGWQQNQFLPDLNDQIAYVARWYIIQASEGVAIASWYAWGVGDPSNPQGWGSMFDADTGQTTSAAAAYQAAESWLNGSTMNGACSADTNNVWSCPLTFSNGVAGLIVWDGNETSSNYTPASKYIQYETLSSSTPTAIPAGSNVTIGEAPILLEAGNR